MQSYFVFRQAQSVDELRALLKLRYKVYRESRLQQFVPENECGIDLDGYDLRSRHFGLFKNNSHPIGYMRVVEDNDPNRGGGGDFEID